MASFTVRIELHNANADDYEVLHGAMAQQGFFPRIRADNGKVYHMPWAEYDYSSEEPDGDVLTRAKAAAARTRRQFAALVTRAQSRMWFGLDPA